jgi:linoleoyl-CoA desaturase
MSTATANPPQTAPEESRLSRLSPEQLDAIGAELDAIRDRVMADLGDRDRRYIESMIAMHRRLAILGRVLLLASRRRSAWFAGTAAR